MNFATIKLDILRPVGTFDSLLLDATITWTLPPPQRGPLQTSDTSVRTTIQRVVNGSSEASLTWNFTLSGEILDRVTFEIDDTRIGKKTSSGIVSIDDKLNFREHFDISRSDPATLIIYNVTEVDEAVFLCDVETDQTRWKDNIKVQVVGKSMVKITAVCSCTARVVVLIVCLTNTFHVAVCLLSNRSRSRQNVVRTRKRHTRR